MRQVYIYPNPLLSSVKGFLVGGGIEIQKTTMQPISFFEYQKEYMQREVDNENEIYFYYEKAKAIEYFLQKHAQVVGPGKHKKLKADTWEDQVSGMFIVTTECDDYIEIDIKQVKNMINHYFNKALKKKYQPKCDFSIVHFNHPEVKKINYYEAAYRGDDE